MNAAKRASLVAAAKSRATAVVSCVQARLSPHHILDRCSRDDLVALVVVLAEAADPAVLRVVVNASEDGPVVTDRMMMLRRAHREVNRLRETGQEIPLKLGVLENQYQEIVRAQRKGRQRGEADGRAA